jgi:hypothetical protein
MLKTIAAILALITALPAAAEIIRLEPNQSAIVAGEPSAMVYYRGYGYDGLSNCHLTVSYEGFEPFTATSRDDNLRHVYTYPQPFQLANGAVVICRSHGDYVEVRSRRYVGTRLFRATTAYMGRRQNQLRFSSQSFVGLE